MRVKEKPLFEGNHVQEDLASKHLIGRPSPHESSSSEKDRIENQKLLTIIT